MVDQNDPEVQRAGFEEIVKTIGLDPVVLEGSKKGSTGGGVSFFDEFFDPDATWEENVEQFKVFARSTSMLGRKAEDALDAVE